MRSDSTLSLLDDGEVRDDEASSMNSTTMICQLTHLSRDAQAAETMLESKISSSFINYTKSNNLFRAGLLLTMIVFLINNLGSLGFLSNKMDVQGDLEATNITFDRVTSTILILSCMISCIGYRATRGNRLWNFDHNYETFTPLSTRDTSNINSVLDRIGHWGYTIGTTGENIRFFSYLIAARRTEIDSLRQEIQLLTDFIEKALLKIPTNVIIMIAEFAIQLSDRQQMYLLHSLLEHNQDDKHEPAVGKRSLK